MTAFFRHNAAELHFYTHARAWGLPADRYVLPVDLMPHPLQAIEYHHSKSGGAFAAQVTFQLLWAQELTTTWAASGWDEILRDDDWFELYAWTNGIRHIVDFGLIDRITPTTQVTGQGATVRTWTIQARSWAKVIDDTQIWFCEVGTSTNYIGEAVLGMLNWNPGGSPDQLCRQLVQGFLQPPDGAGGAWAAPDTYRGNDSGWWYIARMLDLVTWVDRCRGFTPVVNEAVGTDFNLAELLRNWGNLAFNELFFDLRPKAPGQLVPAMVVREQPFPVEFRTGSDVLNRAAAGGLDAWRALPEVEIPRTQVLGGETLGRGGAGRVNSIMLSSTIDTFSVPEQLKLSPPHLDEASARIHGLRKLELTTRFSNRLEGDEIGRWRYLLQQWYAPLPELYDGSIPLVGFDPRLRVGRRIRITEESPTVPELRAYIEGVSLSWTPGGGWYTTLTVSRGVYGGEDLYLDAISRTTTNLPVRANPTVPLVPTSDDLACYNVSTDLIWRVSDVAE